MFPQTDLADTALKLPRPATRLAMRIELSGRVQGLGVRPAVARLAARLNLAGSVSNSTCGVQILVEGRGADVATFRTELGRCLPKGTRIESRHEQPIESQGGTHFCIEPSDASGPLTARVPPDVAVCAACLAETNSPGDRRHDYAFTTCTGCGPRYSLVDSLPYDRAATAMRRFVPCPRCAGEYRDSSDRRFHSQTNSCPTCGPRLLFHDRLSGRVSYDDEAVTEAVRAIDRGQIVGLKGVGGFQLLVDATSAAAVRALRRRKQRAGKPLAIMVATLAEVDRLAVTDAAERSALCDPSNPIVILRQRDCSALAPQVTEGLNTIGVMLPTSPIHDQLARGVGKPLVVTSGNLEGDPLEFHADTADRDLCDLADAWLDHDRPILRPIDDSVVRIIAGRTATMRLARGLAPLPLELSTRPMLALGGHQKAAIALSNGAQAVLGPHVGDLDGEATRARYLEHIDAMLRLYRATPELIVCDRHPDYFSTRWAATQALPVMAVGHHHAHVAAVMLERGWLDRQVLGVAWDGTGYGDDDTIWGGEFLLATAAQSRRVGRLRPLVLPGGELAVRQPWRVAVSLVYQAVGPEVAARLRFIGVTERQVEQVVGLLSPPRSSSRTTSAGRLFDGVAALLLGITLAEFEGQGAMLLEANTDPDAPGEYPLVVTAGDSLELDWRPLVREALADRTAGISPSTIATRFHRALAGGIANVATMFADCPVVLAGGCFQNKLLTELIVERLPDASEVATPGEIPTGDGGLAAGQLTVAAARVNQGWQPCA